MKKKWLVSLVCITSLGTLVACGNTDKSTEGKTESVSEKNKNTENSSESKETLSEKVGLEEVKVSLDDAIAKFKKKHPEAEIFSVDLKKEGSRLKFIIEGSKDDVHYITVIDADTDEIIKEDEQEKNLDEGEDPLVLDGIIKPEEAIKKALESVKGDFRIVAWNLENDSNKLVYKLELRERKSNTETAVVKINANTGNLVGN